MYRDIKFNIRTCAACTLSHRTRPHSELLYTFPVDAPFITVHADAWVPGKTVSFDGHTCLMIVMCNLTGFVAIEPLSTVNAQEFARSIFTIMLRYGISQLVITDADSKFKGAFKEAMEILKIKHHMASKGNHNAVMVERFNVFLNSSLTAFTNDRQTN
eukprot:13790585-Ditylum_brightwellii.AAC.1